MSVPTKSTIPMMASQSRPSNTNPTIDSTTHATSKMRRTVHMSLTLRATAGERQAIPQREGAVYDRDEGTETQRLLIPMRTAGEMSTTAGCDPPRDAFALAAAALAAAGSDDLCSPLLAAVSMPGAVVSTLGSPMGSQTVCASARLGARIDEIQIDLGEGPSWEALRTRRPVAASDLQIDGGALWPGAWAALRELDLGSLYAFPLFVGAVGIGSIALYAMAARELTGTDVAGMSRLAVIISGTLLRRALDRLETTDEDAPDEPYSRREVHQATGMVAARNGIGVDDALMLLRGHAYGAGRPVREVAADVIARRLDLGL